MSDKTSQTFQDTANDITSEIDKALSGAGYVGSIVLELRCSFGYSGFNCQDNWLYLLTIIGSVLGGLLLITLIVLLVVALKSPKKSSKKSKNEDIGKPYISHSAAKAPLANGSYSNGAVGGPANGLSANVGVPRIPRATSTNAWGSRSNLEMTPTNSRQNLIATGTNLRLNDDRDDMFSYSQTRPQTNPYAQSRPQNNSYAQNRANFNPYA
ncbi:uncharacterized protein [Leuresthes tenuis]|uniref:uncharacterized protein n=1 Tax=Leuresthes tenuis TaxID=355514 RepID=UPI003B502166